jgi:hypothetical protein
MLLNKWSPLFDANKEIINKVPIWVHLPGILVDFWTKESFKEIGNVLGLFLDVDMSFESLREMFVARILVFLDVKEGWAEEFELVEGSMSYVQKLDYKGFSFRCRRCH